MGLEGADPRRATCRRWKIVTLGGARTRHPLGSRRNGSSSYPLLRQAGRELEERGVRFFDASGVFRDIEERIYNDACHFERRGNEILAEAIGQAFLDGM